MVNHHRWMLICYIEDLMSDENLPIPTTLITSSHYSDSTMDRQQCPNCDHQSVSVIYKVRETCHHSYCEMCIPIDQFTYNCYIDTRWDSMWRYNRIEIWDIEKAKEMLTSWAPSDIMDTIRDHIYLKKL